MGGGVWLQGWMRLVVLVKTPYLERVIVEGLSDFFERILGQPKHRSHRCKKKLKAGIEGFKNRAFR
jgi:hypothetical protein